MRTREADRRTEGEGSVSPRAAGRSRQQLGVDGYVHVGVELEGVGRTQSPARWSLAGETRGGSQSASGNGIPELCRVHDPRAGAGHHRSQADYGPPTRLELRAEAIPTLGRRRRATDALLTTYGEGAPSMPRHLTNRGTMIDATTRPLRPGASPRDASYRLRIRLSPPIRSVAPQLAFA